jgi:serine/threonine protein kinase
MRECDIHKRINHENIVRLYTYFERENTVYLLLEYAEKGNLFYIIRNKK